eukprot:scaffold11920_cov91-Skeletonema_menzelii.AAC.4
MIIVSLVGLFALVRMRAVSAHGYMTSPRSRNLLASEETVWWPQTENDPMPETCPHCLNLGGTLARCGIVQERNYDAPKNALGGPMPTKVQATYHQGQDIIIDVSLTAHHKGHFVFSACPIVAGEIPSQACFDDHKLTFIEDVAWDANFDPNYPERAYIAPMNNPDYVLNPSSSVRVMDFSFKMRLPPDLYGDVVLIQWYYLTANSCVHDGYDQYDWPDGWGTPTADKCGTVSSDGVGSPEQFWNCAEVKILKDANYQQQQQPQPKPTTEVSAAFSVDAVNAGDRKTHDKTIIGYFCSWQWYDRAKLAKPQNMDFSKVQRVNFAFFQTNESGDIFGTDSWADANLLFGPYNWNPQEGSKEYCSWDAPNVKACNHHFYEEGLISLVHAAGATLYPSLGGWTLSDPFPAMAASAVARANFAKNCVKLIEEYDFDGIDLDWEYPGMVDHSGTPDDKGNFKLLLEDVRAALDDLGKIKGRFYGLTAALPCGPDHISNIDIAHTANVLSELNLMTDFFGAWSPTTGVNAPLYYQGWGDEDFNVAACVENWIAGGGKRHKVNIGLPFYGRSFLKAKGLNEPHSGADKNEWGIDDGTPQYYNIVSKLPLMTQMWDEKTWTQLAYFEGGGFVSFDNENAICAKTEFMIKHGLNGGIIWELSGDLMEDLSTPLLDVVNEKLLNPDMSCGQPGEVFTTPLITGGSTSTVSSSSSSSSSESSSAVGSSSALPSTFVSDDAASENPILLFCGEKQDSLNIISAETLVLSFAYELHRPIDGVSEQAAIRSLKKTMLKSIADKLQCRGDFTLRRSLRTKDAHQHIVAVEANLYDTPNKKSPCTIPINHAVPTICHSMIGSMKAYFAQGTPSQTLNNARDELLFFIRTTMSSGAYESVEVRKVIYIEDLSVGVIHSNPPTNSKQVLVWQENDNETSSSSLLTGIVITLSVAFVGLLGFLFMSRRKRRGTMLHNFPHNQVEGAEERNNDEDLESIWQQALNVYKVVEDPTDHTSDDKAGIEGTGRKVSVAVEPEGFLFRPNTNTEPPDSEMAAPVTSESINDEDDEDETKVKESLSMEVQDGDDDGSTASDEKEKKRNIDENEEESLSLEPRDDEGIFGPDTDQGNNYTDTAEID